MRAKSLGIAMELEVIDGGRVEPTCGALASRLGAKIAKREGRWRQRMPSHRDRSHAGLPPCPEAA